MREARLQRRLRAADNDVVSIFGPGSAFYDGVVTTTALTLDQSPGTCNFPFKLVDSAGAPVTDRSYATAVQTLMTTQ